jgi:hypothetical protein
MLMVRTAACISGLYIGILLIPGLFLHRTTTPEIFAFSDEDLYSFVYGSALRMVLGQNPSDLRINYGLFSAFSIAFLAKTFAIETFAGWIRLTQFFQLLIPFCTAGSTWILERNRRLVFFTLLITAQWATTFHAIPTAGFRFLGFAFLPLVLAVLKKYDGLSGALTAALASAAFILWNTETGLACTAALFFYIFVSTISNQRTALGAFWLIAVALATSISLVIVIVIILLGNAANPALLLAQLVGLAGSGYNGHLFDKYVFIAVCIALYASSLVVYCCLRVRDGSADRDLITRAALATSAIVWLAYYAHNAFYYVLWTHLLLLLPTFGPIIKTERALILATALGITFNMIVFPWVLRSGSEFTMSEPTIEGIALPKKVALYLQQRNDQIKSIQSHDMFYFVSAPFITTLMTKRTNDWPIFDPFAETWTKEEFENLIQNLNKHHPSLILIESDESPLLDGPRREFFHRVRNAISPNFSSTATKDGLEFWSRKQSSTN